VGDGVAEALGPVGVVDEVVVWGILLLQKIADLIVVGAGDYVE